MSKVKKLMCFFFFIVHIRVIPKHIIICNRITKTRLYNFNPLKPHFYMEKLGFTWVFIIVLIAAQKHR